MRLHCYTVFHSDVRHSSDRCKLNKIYNGILGISGGVSSLQPPWDLGSGGTNNSDFLCLQDVNISDLEFRVAHSGLNRIWYFSLRHNLQVPVTGLKAGMFVFRNFHDNEGLFPAASSFKKYVESVVLLSGEGFSRLVLCLLYLALKSFARPT